MKYFLNLLLFSMTAFNAYSQLYLKPAAEMGFYSFNTYSQNNYNFDQYNANYTFTEVNNKFGTGIKYGGSLGYNFSNTISTEIGVSYFRSNETKYHYYQHHNYFYDSSYYETDYKYYGNFLMIEPSVVISRLYNKIEPYIIVSFIMGTGDVTYHISHKDSYNGNSIGDFKYHGNLAYGLNTSLGLYYRLFKRINLFSEIGFNYFSYIPKYLSSSSSSRINLNESRTDQLGPFSLYMNRSFTFINLCANVGVRIFPFKEAKKDNDRRKEKKLRRKEVNDMKLKSPIDSTTKNLKFYINGRYEEYDTDYRNYIIRTNSDYSFNSHNHEFIFGSLSVACKKNDRRGNSHEIEFGPSKIDIHSNVDILTIEPSGISQAINGAEVFKFETSSRYQFNFVVIKKETAKLKPYIGISPNLFFSHLNISPKGVSTTYRRSWNDLGLGFSLIPGLEMKVTKSISLDFNIPFRFYEFVYEQSKTDNPTIPEKLRVKYEPISKFLPTKYFFRLGVVYKV